MDETQVAQLVQALFGSKGGWLLAVVTWVGATRLALKPVGVLVEKKLNDALASVCETPEEDDDTIAMKILSNAAYRWTNFLSGWLLSVKLPTTASFLALKSKQNPNNVPLMVRAAEAQPKDPIV